MAALEDYNKSSKTKPEVAAILRDVTGEERTSSEKMLRYSAWAETYENDVELAGYVAPQNAAKEVAAILGPDQDAKILDFLCGTGLVGAELIRLGYRNLDGLDGCGSMLKVAKSKGIYNMLQEEMVEETPLRIQDDIYDLVVSTGSFVPGHVNQNCLNELIRITKPGGHVVLLMLSRYKETEDLKDIYIAILDRVTNGYWSLVSNKIGSLVSEGDGDLYVLKLLGST